MKHAKRSFDEVARNAAILAEDMKSLQPGERIQIAEILLSQMKLALAEDSSAGANFAYPIIPSSGLLTEKARRKAPKQKWLDRDRSLKPTPVDFIAQVYGDRLGRGFTQADLKACDKSCYYALHQWLQRRNPATGEQNRIPPNIDLPSAEDWNARRVRQLRAYPASIDEEERRRLSFVIAGRAYRRNEIK